MGYDSFQLQAVASAMFDEYLKWLNRDGEEMFDKRFELEYAFNLADTTRYPQSFTSNEAKLLAKAVYELTRDRRLEFRLVTIRAEYVMPYGATTTSLIIMPNRN